jgi:O-antigen/teichoic acid export membrane protein
MPMLSIGPKQLDRERSNYLGSVMVQQAGFAVLSTLLVVLGIWLVDFLSEEWNLSTLTWPLAVAVLASQLQNFVRRLFFAFGRGALAFFVDFVRYAGQIVVLFWLLRMTDMHAWGALWVIAWTSLASTLLAAGFQEKVSWNRGNFYTTFHRHWAFSKWLLFSEPMRWVTGHFYLFVAGAMLGAAAVGAIRAAQNLVGLSHIMMLGLENVVPAGAAKRLRQSGKKVFLQYQRRMMIFGGCIVGAVGIVASAAPDFWLELVYGKDYVGSGDLVVWWSVIYFLGFLAQQISIGLRTIERTKSLFWAHLTTATISVVTVYPLIHYFDQVGAMAGILAVELVRLALLTYSYFDQLRRLES